MTGYLSDDMPVYVISVAAQLAGMHPQTLRQYDRLGLVSPGRAAGRGRRYSARDIARLREVQRLSQDEGINLAGIQRIMMLEQENEALREQIARLRGRVQGASDGARRSRVLAVGSAGEVVVTSARSSLRSTQSLVVWRPPSV